MPEAEDELIGIMKRKGIDTVGVLPCDKARNLFYRLMEEKSFRTITLNKEEDGVGISAGIYLAHGKPAMVIQSSGLGNCFNALLSLSVTYELPLPIIASWRGVYQERIRAQIPFNQNLPKALRAWGLPYAEIRKREDVGLVEEVLEEAYERNTPFVALLSPEVWGEGGKREPRTSFPERRRTSVKYEGKIEGGRMTRYEAMRVIAEHLEGEAVVSNIGIPSRELYEIRDRELNFYMLGSYGQASSIGLGISLKAKRETLVLEGDGGLLATSVLSVIAAERPKNLSIICLDNGTFGSTGDQLTHAYSWVDLELLALANGIRETCKVHSKEELESVMEELEDKEGPRFVHVILKPGNAAVKEIPLTPVEIKERFRKAVLGD